MLRTEAQPHGISQGTRNWYVIGQVFLLSKSPTVAKTSRPMIPCQPMYVTPAHFDLACADQLTQSTARQAVQCLAPLPSHRQAGNCDCNSQSHNHACRVCPAVHTPTTVTRDEVLTFAVVQGLAVAAQAPPTIVCSAAFRAL